MITRQPICGGNSADKMSLLPPEVHSALSQLLRGLTTADNAVRSQAEEQLNNDWIQNRPDVLLMGLVEQIHGAEDAGVSAGLEDEKREEEALSCLPPALSLPVLYMASSNS